jgi:tetratricopeptide (TPR) repeat protein
MNDDSSMNNIVGEGKRKVQNLPRHHGAGFLVVLIAGIGMYLPLLCDGVCSVESAGFIALHSGASPLPSAAHPIWTGVVRLLELVPFGPLSLKLNLFSAACAMLAVALLYRLLTRIETGARSPGTAVSPSTASPSAPPPPFSFLLRHGPAVIGALTLAVSFPFWFVATRAHVDPMSILLIVGGLEAAAQYSLSGRKGAAARSALWFGLAATCSPVAAGMGAVCAVWIAVTAHARGHWSLPLQTLKGRARLRIGWLAVWAGAGLTAIALPLLIRAALFLREPAAQWVGTDTYGDALFEVAKAMADMYRMAVPRLGAILLGAVILLPAGLVSMAIRSERQESPGRPLMVHLFVSVFALAILFDIPIAPWSFYGASPLLTAPYLIVALWTGFAAAGVTRLILGRLHRTDLPGPLSKRNLTPELRRRWASVYVLLMLSGLAVAGARNGIRIGRTFSAPFDAFARAVLDETRGGDWLVSASPLNDLLAVKIKEAGLPLHILNPALSRIPAYMAHVADSFPDDPRMRSLTDAGLDAALPDWIARDASVTGKLAVLDLPSLWSAGRFTPVPGRAVYRGAAEVSPDDLASFAADLDAWRPHLERMKRKVHAQPAALRGHGLWMLRHLGRMVNDRGAILESRGRTDDALAQYRAAAEHDPDNYSAALNLERLARSQSHPEADRFAAALHELGRRLGNATNSMDLARAYGWIVRPPAPAASTPDRTAASPGTILDTERLAEAVADADADADLLRAMRAAIDRRKPMRPGRRMPSDPSAATVPTPPPFSRWRPISHGGRATQTPSMPSMHRSGK